MWLAGIIVAALALGGLLMPWWRPAFARRQALRRRAANVAAYRGRLDELEADVQAGVLAAEAVEGTKQELAARLLQDTTAPAPAALEQKPSGAMLGLVALGLLVFAGAWYGLAGSWRTQALVELAQNNPALAQAQAVDDEIARLRRKVAANPGDVESWLWLGRSYASRGNSADAAQAFEQASAGKGHQDPDVLVEWGEALAFAQDRAMEGAPSEKFAQALALAPDHPQALWYSGVAALQAGDDRAAIAHWERLSQQPLPDQLRATLEHSLSRLRERTGTKAPAQARAPAPASPPATAPSPSAVALNVHVSLAPELAAAVGPDDALFVFAQDPAGPPMPLAVQRLTAGQLPAQVTLDDSNSMTPQRKLSSVSRWRVIARVSKAGSAIPQAGDLEGAVEVGKAEAGKPVKVVISRTR